MTIDELLQIIHSGENQKTEFKTSFDQKALVAINAMANSSGGYVIIGVSDKGHILGVSLGKGSLQNWANEIKLKIEPQILPELSLVTIDSYNVVVIKIDEYPVKPVSLQGRYYQRQNNSNHLLSLAKIAELHLQSLQLSWDSYEYGNKSLADLDDQKIDAFIEELNLNRLKK